jgi:glycosyltransferase involved in cell wall biosynthesis
MFVFPSRREGFGNVVLEAMAMELPVVLTPYKGLPEELGTAGREYVLSRPDPDSVAAHIETLLDDLGRRQALGRAARHWAEQHMDMEMVIDDYAELYRDVAMRGRKRSGLTSPTERR